MKNAEVGVRKHAVTAGAREALGPVAWLGALASAAWLHGAGAASLPPRAAPDQPVPISVPANLLRLNTSIEPSGVVWAPALDRFLVISDDTGVEGRKHQPWVFAMNRQGAFDEAPVQILGIDELNDPEAICGGPDGTFFLTTSHSANRKGRTSPARKMLLHLRLVGRALRVEGRIDLTTAQDAKGGGLLAIAGLDPQGSLDIEALCYREGALLVGLKAPLTSQGAAVILRLDAAVQTLKTGRIGPGAVRRFREVNLDASGPPGAISRGISDLMTLSDGSILLAANSPKGMPSDGGGAIYWLKPGSSSPVLLQGFPGLKPEGITLSEDGKGLVVVFDNDQRPPLWVRWSLPH